MKIIAYHGSQHKNFNFDAERALYFTTDKQQAESYAKRDWDEGLVEGEIPVVFTFELNLKHPLEIKDSDKFFDFCESSMNEYLKDEIMKTGYDSVIFEDVKHNTKLIAVFNENQFKIIDKEVLPKSHEYYYQGDIDPNDVDDYYYDEYELDESYKIKLKEAIKPLNPEYSDSKIITSDNSLIQYMNNHPNLRIIFDKRKKIYLVADVETSIHYDVMGDAIQTGFYSDATVSNNLENDSLKYFDNHNNDLYCFISYGDRNVGKMSAEDGYKFEYHYPNISIYTRNEYFEKMSLYKALGKCKKEKLHRYDEYELDESIEYATSKNNSLTDVILKNPSRKELKENKLLYCRLVSDDDGNIYFGSAYEYIHATLKDTVAENGVDFDIYGETYNYGFDVWLYDCNSNTFWYRVDEVEDEFDEIKVDLTQQLKSTPYFTKNFGNFNVEVTSDELPSTFNGGKSYEKQLKLNESTQYAMPMIYPNPTYKEFHNLLRNYTSYGKLSAIIDGNNIYCWDSGLAHHSSMIHHIEERLDITISDDAIWVRFREPNDVWVSAEYFDGYDDEEIEDMDYQDVELSLENNPVIKKYFPKGIHLLRFNQLNESVQLNERLFPEIPDDTYDYILTMTSPTEKANAYTKWCAQQYLKNGLVLDDDLYDLCNSHKILHQAGQVKPIMDYSSVQELKDDLAKGYRTNNAKDKEASKGAKLIHSFSNWNLYDITTWAAAKKYGYGTKWCVTYSDDNSYFKRYVWDKPVENAQGKLFYVINGNDKYAYATEYSVHNGWLKSSVNVFDELDDNIGSYGLISTDGGKSFEKTDEIPGGLHQAVVDLLLDKYKFDEDGLRYRLSEIKELEAEELDDYLDESKDFINESVEDLTKENLEKVIPMIEEEFFDHISEDDIKYCYSLLTTEEKNAIRKELGMESYSDAIDDEDYITDNIISLAEDLANHNRPFNRLPKSIYHFIYNMVKDRILYGIRTLIKEFEQHDKLYRMIATDLEPQQLIDFIKENGLGNCWAKAGMDYTMNYCGEGKYTYVFEGTADLNDINWIKTIYLRVIMEEEDEIRLKKDAKVQLLNIYMLDNELGDYRPIDIVQLKYDLIPVGSKFLYEEKE